jgi:pimeloyl-ACP methyl ester carboxylesterase/membrane protein DedA with SNARE-associated domain
MSGGWGQRVLRPVAWVASRRWAQVYLALLVASHVVIALGSGDRVGDVPRGVETVELPRMGDAGPAPGGRTFPLRYSVWGEAGGGRAPIIMLHGSPSFAGGRDFARLAPELADRGWRLYGVDLPGFGHTPAVGPSYSIVANARLALSFMDALGIERAHVLGWSQGGGSALHAADLAPGRVASLCLLASIGVQEAEGSGSYHFEHMKYALGFIPFVAAPELIPHFGLLGDRGWRYAFIRNFWDSDQRPLRAIMEALEVPTLVIQGRHDFLVPAWAATETHRLVGSSRLLMLDAGHFLTFGEAVEPVVAAVDGFAARHDAPGVPVRRGVADLEPESGEEGPTLGGFRITHGTAWWVIILVIVLATLISEDLTVIAVGLLIASGQLDFGVGVIGCALGIVLGDYGLWALGRFAGRRALRLPLIRRVLPEPSLDKWSRIFDAHIAKTVLVSRMLPGTRLPMYVAAGILAKRSNHFLLWVTVAVLIWTPLLLTATILIGPKLLGFFETILHGPWVIVASFAVLVVLIRLVSYEATALGRQRLKADLRRVVSLEFWPPVLFYLPLVPWVAWLALRYRAMSFTCANPGIPNGGGIVGESKSEIIRGLAVVAPEETLAGKLIEAGPSEEVRAQRVIDLARGAARFGGYPVVLKPDFAQRGHGVRLARDDEEVRRYFRAMGRDAHLQRYSEAREEVGVLWARVPGGSGPVDEWPGEIFSVTRKVFPVIEGDGERTLEELVWDHPRYRMQAKLFLRRFDAETDRVLAKGERLRLTMAGNHAQGTMFLDGDDLITPELTRRIDRIARAYRRPGGGEAIDFGRFDIRYDDEAALRRGEGFAIIELNGSMSESTNIYDPHKPVWWTYGVLFRQWTRLFRLGAARRREGRRPLRVRSLYRLLRDHFRGRPGSAVSD